MHLCKKASITYPAEKDGDLPTKMSMKSESIPLKEKTTKAERRALQEAQRAAKAAGKGSNGLYLILDCYVFVLYGFSFLSALTFCLKQSYSPSLHTLLLL